MLQLFYWLENVWQIFPVQCFSFTVLVGEPFQPSQKQSRVYYDNVWFRGWHCTGIHTHLLWKIRWKLFVISIGQVIVIYCFTSPLYVSSFMLYVGNVWKDGVRHFNRFLFELCKRLGCHNRFSHTEKELVLERASDFHYERLNNFWNITRRIESCLLSCTILNVHNFLVYEMSA